jgi:hypothetical protein
MARNVFVIIALISLLFGCGGSGNPKTAASEEPEVEEQEDSLTQPDTESEVEPDTTEPIETPSTHFSEPVNISSNPTNSGSQSVVRTNDGVLHVAWVDDGNLAFSQSYDNGASFTEPLRLVDSGVMNSLDYTRIGLTESAIHLTFTFYQQGSFSGEIFYMRSLDGGLNFSTPILLSNDDGHSSVSSTISTDGLDRVVISWSNRIGVGQKSRYVLSDDNGVSFTDPAGIYAVGSSPKILLSSTNMFTTWIGGENLEQHFYFVNATKNKNIDFRSSPVIIERDIETYDTQMYVDDRGTLYLFWTSNVGGNPVKVMSSSEDDGRTFSERVVISDPDYPAYCSRVLFTGTGTFYIAWLEEQDRNIYKSYLSRTEDGGETFSHKLELKQNQVSSEYPFCPTLTHISDGQYIGMIYSLEMSNLRNDIFYTTLDTGTAFD